MWYEALLIGVNPSVTCIPSSASILTPHAINHSSSSLCIINLCLFRLKETMMVQNLKRLLDLKILGVEIRLRTMTCEQRILFMEKDG